MKPVLQISPVLPELNTLTFIVTHGLHSTKNEKKRHFCLIYACHYSLGEVLRISSEGDETFDSRIFLGRKIWQVFFGY